MYFRVDGRGMRVFRSSHEGGIMNEDGIAIPEKVYYRLLDEPKPFIRVVSIPEKRFKDYPLSEFSWKPRNENEHDECLTLNQTEERIAPQWRRVHSD